MVRFFARETEFHARQKGDYEEVLKNVLVHHPIRQIVNGREGWLVGFFFRFFFC